MPIMMREQNVSASVFRPVAADRAPETYLITVRGDSVVSINSRLNGFKVIELRIIRVLLLQDYSERVRRGFSN
jgi:hypothetical protein